MFLELEELLREWVTPIFLEKDVEEDDVVDESKM